MYELLLLHMIQGEDEDSGNVLVHKSKDNMRLIVNLKEDSRDAKVVENDVYSY